MMNTTVQHVVIDDKGQWLAPDAAADYLAARAAGCPAGVTDAGRTDAEQQQLYDHQGQPGWPAKADTPAGSKHTKGQALDLPAGGPREWMTAHGPDFGYHAGRVKGEPWHFEHEGGQHAAAPVTTTKEEDMKEFIAHDDRGVFLIAPGYQHHLNPTEYEIAKSHSFYGLAYRQFDKADLAGFDNYRALQTNPTTD